jgi:hypothetical protein
LSNFRAHGLFKIIIIITKIIEKKGGSQRKEDDEIGGGEQLTETNGPLSLDEAKTLSQSPPAPAAGLFKERREKTMATCGRSLDEQRANATASHNLATAIYFFISA